MGPHLCHLLNAWGAAAGQPMDRGQRLLVLHRAVADMVGQQTTVGFRAMAMICWEQMRWFIWQCMLQMRTGRPLVTVSVPYALRIHMLYTLFTCMGSI